MAGNEQFDEFLGGSQKLPQEIHTMKLISARASEIAAMTYSIENPQQTKLVFQKLPVYMRRRVMSHNVKRLPRRLREAHLNQMTKSGLPPKTSRPSRKYRRRPRNLLAEYNRRQQKKIWLETHVWHAKRFHMTEKWGYRIANFANDKCFRANYRAVSKHCLMQDISYYTCIEIKGPETLLAETLKAHCNPSELTFAAKIFVSGTREGTVLFYKKDGYPLFPIGYVYFLWKPKESDLRTIWIWVHPSFLDDIIKQISTSFEFESLEKPFSYENKRNCSMIVHKNTLNRFRFLGPLTLNVLTNALQLPSFNENISFNSDASGLDDETMDCDEGEQSSVKSWHLMYYSNQQNMKIFQIQKQLWQQLKTLQSPSQLPPNIVLGFTVLDPRFHMPIKRTKPQSKELVNEIIKMPPMYANTSPIWEYEIRQNVSGTCQTTNEINKIRKQCLVPGLSNDNHFNEEIMTKIPIMLIQKPGVGNTGLSSGIDVILPSNWAMPFWLACVLQCTKVGALREAQCVAFEYGNLQSPDINDPDTSAYVQEAHDNLLELKKRYFRYPPNRRVNFTKLAISSPFFCEWKMLMKEWTDTESFFVLRDRKLLKLLQESISNIRSKQSNSHMLESTLQNAFQNRNCLVRVKITIVKRGCPKKFAIICMPTIRDIEEFKRNKNWSGPVQKSTADPNENIRKTMRKNHLVLLKRLRRRRIQHKKSLANQLRKTLNKDSETSSYENTTKKLLQARHEAVEKQFQNMAKLYLPNCSKVRHSCDREIMGFVTAGDFSFSEAKGVALGYITLNSLIELITKKFNCILLRNIQSRQYRIAKLDVIS